MKKLLLPVALCLSMLASASAPQTITYQAVVRNNTYKLVRSKPVGVRISILWGSETGSTVYTETRHASTNINGLLTFAIGDKGAESSDDLSKINWSDGPYFIKCEMDPTGGSNYSLESTSQLMSVPYAMYAERISSDATPAWTQTPEKPVYQYSEIEGAPDIKDIAEQDPEFKKSVAAGISSKDTARWNQKLDGYTESDPKFEASAAASITKSDIDKWNNKQDKTEETDPEFAKSVAAGITKSDTMRWNQAANMPANVITNVDIQNWNGKLDSYTETDPEFAKSIASTITKADIDNWNSKMSSYSETDPAFTSSLAAGITAADTARWNKVQKLENQPANSITNVDITNWNNKLDSYTETDPAFAQSVAAGITKSDTARWNKLEKNVANSITENQIINWNNKLDNYSETDPYFIGSVAAGISKSDTARWNKMQKLPASSISTTDITNWNSKLSEEVDPAFAKSEAAKITAADVANWNNKLDSNAETDPIFAKSEAAKITSTDVANWNAKLSEETDPEFAKSTAAKITVDDVANWNNKLDSYTETDPTFAKSEASKITATDVANWNAKLSEETDPEFAKSEAAKITATDIANWNNKLAEESDPAFIKSVASGITKEDTTRWNKAQKQPASAITKSDIENWNGKLSVETDPVYKASVASGITAKDTARWNKFNKSAAATITEGDIEYWNDIMNQFPDNITYFENDAHYVTENQLNRSNNLMFNTVLQMEKYYEDSLMAVSKKRMEHYVDSVRTVQKGEMTSYKETVNNMPSSGITSADIANWNSKLASETDPVYTASAASGITSTDIANWNSKLGSYTETDPVYTASAASGITSADIANWNSKLDSYTETDPVYSASVAANIKASDTLRWGKKLGANDIADWAKQENKPTYNYSEIVGTPEPVTVPTKVSAFENDKQYITKAEFDHYKDSMNTVLKGIKDETAELKKLVDGLLARESKTKFLVTLVAGEGGKVVGGGYLSKDTTITIKALADEEYEFVKWSDGNTTAERSITVTSDVYLSAVFAKKNYTISLSASPADGGTVTGAGTYEVGANVAIKSVPSKGYVFVKWSDNVTDSERTMTVTENIDLNAIFELDPNDPENLTYNYTTTGSTYQLQKFTAGESNPTNIKYTGTGDLTFVVSNSMWSDYRTHYINIYNSTDHVLTVKYNNSDTFATSYGSLTIPANTLKTVVLRCNNNYNILENVY